MAPRSAAATRPSAQSRATQPDRHVRPDREERPNRRIAPDSPARQDRHSKPAAKPELGVLDRRHVVERARRRQARVLSMMAGMLIAAPLLVSALAHAYVASEQVRSDAIQQRIETALQTQQDLQLRRAQLLSPSSILSVAEIHQHMVFPAAVTYLPAVNPGETVAEAHQPGTLALAPASQTIAPVHHIASSPNGTSPTGTSPTGTSVTAP